MRRPQRLDVLVVGDTSSVHIRRYVGGLAGLGLRVAVAGFEPEGYDEDTPMYSLGRTSSSDLRFVGAVPRLARLVRRLRPAILNAHYVSSYGLLGRMALVGTMSPDRPALVQTAWGTDLLVTARASRSRRRLAAIALRGASLVTGDSADLESEARHLAPSVPFHRFLFGPPGALLEAPRHAERILVSTRRLDPDTRVQSIVRAFGDACRAQPQLLDGWRLIVAADGRDREAVVDAARGAPRVELVGWLGAQDLQALLLRSHACLSVPVSDATSAALLEAMACGVIPVVNDLPANREWVDPSVGMIVPRDPTPTDLVEAIIKVTRLPIDRAVVRARVAPFTWEAEIARLGGAMRRLIDRPGS